QLMLLHGLQDGLKGRRRVAMPAGWSATAAKLSQSPSADVRHAITALAVTFGDAAAFAELRRVLADARADPAARQAALARLLQAEDSELAAVLEKLVSDTAMRGSALRALGAYDDPKTPEIILSAYHTLNSAEKRDAIGTLTSRAAYGRALLDAVASKTVPAAE